MENNHIPNDELTQAFKKHFEIDGNDRIIFSGQFGIGKSTFLKNYFKNNNNYNVIHLYPVNYSIASNEDILSLLQYDIIYELLGIKGFEIEKKDFSEIEILKMFGTAKFDELFLPMAEYIPKVGKPLVHFIKMLKKYDKFRDEATGGDESIIKKLLSEVEDQKGSFYKQDAYTDFIIASLEKLKGNDPKRKNVLIIDDLDRIDPEHIFRLFNVFAAHFDLHKEEKNKFGFDKVIFVCDIENIREIFHYKYGIKAGFSGYIDKFFSVHIFYVDNKAALQNFIESVLGNTTNYLFHFLYDILSKMIETKVVNFRNIQAIYHQSKISKGDTEFDQKLFFTQIARILTMICGDAETLVKNLENCYKRLDERNASHSSQFGDSSNMDFYLNSLLIPTCDYWNHRFSTGTKEFAMLHLTKQGDLSFQYTLHIGQDNKIFILLIKNGNEVRFNQVHIYFWKLIINSVKVLIAEGIIA